MRWDACSTSVLQASTVMLSTYLVLLVLLEVPLEVPVDLLLGGVLSLLPSEGVDGAGVSSGATSA